MSKVSKEQSGGEGGHLHYHLAFLWRAGRAADAANSPVWMETLGRGGDCSSPGRDLIASRRREIEPQGSHLSGIPVPR